MTDPTDYRTTLNALPLLAWVARPDGALEYLNRRCAEYTGRPLDDLLGWDWGWAVHPADRPEALRRWTAAVRSGTPHATEHRLLRYDGAYRWFLARAEPARDTEGRVVRWFGTCTDVGEATREAAPGRSPRTLFHALVERSPDGLALVGPDGTVQYANSAAAWVLGSSSVDVGGTSVWGAVHAKDRGRILAWWNELVSGTRPERAARAHFTQRDGTARRVEVTATNLLSDPDVRAIAVRMRGVNGTGAP